MPDIDEIERRLEKTFIFTREKIESLRDKNGKETPGQFNIYLEKLKPYCKEESIAIIDEYIKNNQ
jgi:hypothetical protein